MNHSWTYVAFNDQIVQCDKSCVHYAFGFCFADNVLGIQVYPQHPHYLSLLSTIQGSIHRLYMCFYQYYHVHVQILALNHVTSVRDIVTRHTIVMLLESLGKLPGTEDKLWLTIGVQMTVQYCNIVKTISLNRLRLIRLYHFLHEVIQKYEFHFNHVRDVLFLDFVSMPPRQTVEWLVRVIDHGRPRPLTFSVSLHCINQPDTTNCPAGLVDLPLTINSIECTGNIISYYFTDLSLTCATILSQNY